MHEGKNTSIMITLKKTYCRKLKGGGPPRCWRTSRAASTAQRA
jgi:hypothetical protein